MRSAASFWYSVCINTFGYHKSLWNSQQLPKILTHTGHHFTMPMWPFSDYSRLFPTFVSLSLSLTAWVLECWSLWLHWLDLDLIDQCPWFLPPLLPVLDLHADTAFCPFLAWRPPTSNSHKETSPDNLMPSKNAEDKIPSLANHPKTHT